MILVTIILIFLIRVGLKIAYIGVSVSSYLHKRYEAKHELPSVVKALGKEDVKGAASITAKKTIRVVGRVGRFISKQMIKLVDLALGLLNKLLIVMLGYVLVLDIIVSLFILGGAGWFLLYISEDEDNLEQVISTVTTVKTVAGSMGDVVGIPSKDSALDGIDEGVIEDFVSEGN